MRLPDYFSFQDLKLQPITDSEIDKTVALINPAYSYQEPAKGAPRTNPTHLRERVSETDFFVVKDHGRIIGCVYLEPKNKTMNFGLLTVANEYRKTGLAPAMITAIEDYAIARNCESMGLAYMSAAPWLKKYYEKYGFRETGQITNWGPIDLIRMTKKLD